MPRSQIPMKMTPDSSTIAGYGYDAASQTLVMQFTGKPGSVPVKDYEYPGTPPEKFAELEAAESKGSWWYKNKSDFPVFNKMEEDAPPVESEGGEAA